MASTYQQVSYGSRGDAVRRLQEALNGKGYSLDVDGVFGEKTRAAVRDYQRKNNLTLDGIVGAETWGSLLQPGVGVPGDPTVKTQGLPGVSDETARRLYELEQGYTPSEEVAAARAAYEQLAAQKPEDYVSSFEEQLSELYGRLSGRDPFAYDPSRDVTYQRYAADYQRRGRAAMEDTLGRAAALSGGYGSTYAQGAGQQAYARQLQELTELIPRLEENARRRYEGEGEDLERQYKLLMQRQQDDYGRWSDGVDRWTRALETARKAAESAESADRAAYQNALKHYTDMAKAEQKAAETAARQAASAAKTSSGGRGSSGGSSGSRSAAQASLSSAAAESLERMVNRYLAAGNGVLAGALAAQYADRMTPAQKRRLGAVFGRYNVNMTK